MKNKRKYIFIAEIEFVMLLFIMLFVHTHLVSAKEKKKIRVGCYQLNASNDISKNNKRYNYDATYLDEISKYTGYEYEYVDCDTWKNAIKMLNDKKVDIVGTTQWYAERLGNLDYCLENYGYTIGEIVTLPENATSYEDYDAMNNMKIGVLEDYVHLKELKDVLSKNHCKAKLVTYNRFDQILDALNSKDIDAVAGNSHILNSKWKVIEKFSYDPIYFVTWKGNQGLVKTLDKALIQINLHNPNFDDETLVKFFPSIDQNALSKEEQDYIESIDHLTFCFCTNEGYLCRTENGKYIGIHPAIAKKICKKLGVTYKEVQFDFPKLIKKLSAINNGKSASTELVNEVRSMGIDVWGDFFYNQSWADTLGVQTSDPYLDASYYEIKKRGTTINHKTCKVAAVQGLRFTTKILKNYQSDQIVWCDDFEDCIKAVKNGHADMTIIDTLAAEYYLSMYQYNDLSSILIDYSNQCSMAIVRENSEILTSILNKTIHSISLDETNTVIRNETTKTPKQNALYAYFYSNPVQALLIVVVVLVGILALFLMIYITIRSRRDNTLLQKATNAKSDFLARMSHDIRTPLNVIIGMSHLAQENDNPEDTQNCLEKIDVSSEFLLGLVNDVLDMEHVESGKIELHPLPYSSDEFTRYIDTVIVPLCENKNIKFTYSLDSDKEYTFLQDKLRTNQIYFNLLSNAVKYTQEGGEINFHSEMYQVSDTQVAIESTISDNGIGMSEEFQAHMFEAFTQENQIMTSLSQGSGLGLSIVKKFCDAMNIDISVKSKLGEGTTYYLQGTYELTKDKPVEEKSLATSKTDYKALHKKTILVCEDHMLNQEIIKKLLLRQEAVPVIMEDGQKGVDAFINSVPGEYAAILMDVRMPIMDGIEATKLIRSQNRPDAKTIPIIALTANAYASDMERTKAAGMNEHLSKPIDPALLYQTLEYYLS